MARHELKQGLSIGAKGAKGSHHKGNQAETETRRGRRGGGSAEVVDGRSAGDGSVGGEAGGGGVEAGDGGRASDIRGLDINQGPGAAAVEVTNNNVGLLREQGAPRKHPLTHGGMAP